MANSQLTIFDEELQDIVSLHGETVTIHLVTTEIVFRSIGRNKEQTISLDEFSLLDDPSVKCIPKVKLTLGEVTDFEIHFHTTAPSTYLYESSLFMMYLDKVQKMRKLKHIGTVNARQVPSESILFPKIASAFMSFLGSNGNRESFKFQEDSRISDNLIFFTKISRKDIPYIFEKKPQMLCSSQMTDCTLLFENKTLSNFTVLVKGREFRVHKEILAAKSPVFLAMFKQEMKEKKKSLMTIEDMEADVFREMLRYIYTNNVHDLNIHAIELFQAADKYDMPKLKLLCADELTRSLKIENSVNILALADRHNESALKERTIKFIGNNIKSILETEEYNEWSLTAPPHLHAAILRTVVLKKFF